MRPHGVVPKIAVPTISASDMHGSKLGVRQPEKLAQTFHIAEAELHARKARHVEELANERLVRRHGHTELAE